MSRVGKLPVAIPSGVSVTIGEEKITVKGKLGELVAPKAVEVSVVQDAGEVKVAPANDTKRARAMWGMTRNIISNMVKGVTDGFTIRLEINGVGYRAAVKGKFLVLMLGYSHDIQYAIPAGITITCEKPTLLVISGFDHQKVGQIAAEIMRFRPFEPYKGKGIFKEGKPGRRKEGKKK